MTNTLAILLALGFAGFLAADIFYFDSAYMVFLGRKFLDLVTWLAFWR